VLTRTFDLYPLRFHFAACAPIHFPPGTSGNTLRGTFGKAFKKLVCNPECRDARTCQRRSECAYALFFEPGAMDGPSGLHDRPRPFVFRTSDLDGITVAKGERFHFGLNIFETREPVIDLFTRALAGFAPRRAMLERVEGRALLRLPLTGAHKAGRIRVRFMTPTELKGADRPDFVALITRIRDRVSTLRALYGAGALDIDFRSMGERATAVKMTRCEIEHVDRERVSWRTGQRHSLGGFVGVAEYEGDLGEFLPYLEIARWTGVGRQTVWGKGEIVCETL
jgi:hypothetical protein